PEATLFFAARVAPTAGADSTLFSNFNGGFNKFLQTAGSGSSYGTQIGLENLSARQLVYDNLRFDEVVVITAKLTCSGHTLVRMNGQRHYLDQVVWVNGDT